MLQRAGSHLRLPFGEERLRCGAVVPKCGAVVPGDDSIVVALLNEVVDIVAIHGVMVSVRVVQILCVAHYGIIDAG